MKNIETQIIDRLLILCDWYRFKIFDKEEVKKAKLYRLKIDHEYISITLRSSETVFFVFDDIPLDLFYAEENAIMQKIIMLNNEHDIIINRIKQMDKQETLKQRNPELLSLKEKYELCEKKVLTKINKCTIL